MPQILFNERAFPAGGTSAYKSQNKPLNHLLAADAGYLLPHIRVVTLSFNDLIYDYGDSIDDVFFPLNSIASALSIMENGTTIEISMVGREGVVGISAILGGGAARHWTKMLIGGAMARISARALDQTFLANESALKFLLRSYGSLITQVSQRAVCNARHTVLERLTCWLLMVHDRVGGENIKLTQEAIASRLGARRAGITVAAGVLQSMGAIEYRRGQLHIKDRISLEASACECYAVMKAEYEGVRVVNSDKPADR
jgi:CRP-like cAMP-binding protein